MVNKVLTKEKDNLVKNVNLKNVNRLSKVKISQKIERKARITLKNVNIKSINRLWKRLKKPKNRKKSTNYSMLSEKILVGKR